MKHCAVIYVLMFVTLGAAAQKNNDLELIRAAFQGIRNEADIEKILSFQVQENQAEEVSTIMAYKAAGECMMAEYVFSPLSKLKYFNAGKKKLEALITEGKQVENIYLRLLIQLNVPKILNYNDQVTRDIDFLEERLPSSSIDPDYKRVMMENLLKLSKKKEQREALLQIKLAASS